MQSSENRTVYFLGAGASKASVFGLPVMKEFFRKEDFESGKYPNLLKFIEDKFGNNCFEKLNLEVVTTFIELGLDTFGSLGCIPDAHVYEVRIEFDKYVKQRLGIPQHQPCPELSKIQ